jgi:hypothetical protein
MPARPRILGSLRWLAALVALGATAARSAGAGATEVVVLPPFEVRDLRPWHIAEVPGLQILSLASERETERFAQRLGEAQWLTPLLLPPGVDGTVSAPSTLFLRHFAGDQLAGKLGAGFGSATFSFSLIWQDTSLVFPSEAASRDWGAGRDYLSLDFLRVTGLAVPRVPAWYRDGMGDLLRTATVSPTAVVFPSRTWKQWEDPNRRPGMDLNPYAQKDPPRLAVRELLALRPAAALALKQSAGDWQGYLRGATLLVHWGFFADGGRHRQGLLRLAARAGAMAADEAMVWECLGLDLKGLQSRLDDHAFGVGRQQIAAPANRPPAPPVVVREATRAEVARTLGEAYLRLSNSVTRDPVAKGKYLASAREVLEDARASGEADPPVFHQLGILAQEAGENDEAIAWLQRAVDGRVARPSAYLSLAELRLNRLAAADVGAKLSAADTAAIWALLRAADSLRPRLPSTYGLGLAMWQNSAVRPTPADLMLLVDGVDAFPEETSLRRDALRLLNKLGTSGLPALAERVGRWRQQLGDPGF